MWALGPIAIIVGFALWCREEKERERRRRAAHQRFLDTGEVSPGYVVHNSLSGRTRCAHGPLCTTCAPGADRALSDPFPEDSAGLP